MMKKMMVTTTGGRDGACGKVLFVVWSMLMKVEVCARALVLVWLISKLRGVFCRRKAPRREKF